MKPAAGLHPERQARRARELMRAEWPELEARREAEIAELPTVDWKGKRLYKLRCTGVSGKGPHLVNVPEALLWHLISLKTYRCPFHANDAPPREGLTDAPGD